MTSLFLVFFHIRNILKKQEEKNEKIYLCRKKFLV